MTIKTDKEKTFDVLWCWGPLSDGTLMLALQDPRPISDIATDFDGCSRFDRKSETEGDLFYEGYTELVSIVRDNKQGTVTLTLLKGEE